jgi:acyl carrier protein
MELNEFVKLFADQFDDTDPSEITAQTTFHDLDEWSSLTALSVLNMVEKKCATRLSFDDLRRAIKIVDIYNIIQNKK